MREYSASEITEYAIKQLTLLGYRVWRQNNLAVKGRKFIGRRGVSDIIGHKRVGSTAVYCEVKKIGDTLKADQIEFLTEAHNDGCFCLVATQRDKEIILLPLLTYLDENLH